MTYFFLLIPLYFLIAAVPCCAAGPTVRVPAGDGGTGLPITGKMEATQNVTGLIIHVVEEGNTRLLPLLALDIAETPAISVEGYVSGIVALGMEGVSAVLGDHESGRIEKEFACEFYPDAPGQYLSDLLPIQAARATSLSSIENGQDALAGSCSFFPTVQGGAVTFERRFEISFGAAGERFTVAVEQNGIRDFSIESSNGREIPFRYFGTRVDELQRTHHDFKTRLKRLADGVSRAESAFLSGLVDHINILDYEGIYNAVTNSASGEIWLYIDALLMEPLDELYTIAVHETLHKLVSKLNLTAVPEMRKFFAELKGYDLFSPERFILVMTGKSSPDASRVNSGHNLFFDFIDERNFLPGMKGGHSNENIEEFCTSIIHSLLHIGRLEENLSAKMKFSGFPAVSRPLTSEEQALIVQTYARTIRCLLKSIPDQTDVSGTFEESARALFSRALREITPREHRTITEASP